MTLATACICFTLKSWQTKSYEATETVTDVIVTLCKTRRFGIGFHVSCQALVVKLEGRREGENESGLDERINLKLHIPN